MIRSSVQQHIDRGWIEQAVNLGEILDGVAIALIVAVADGAIRRERSVVAATWRRLSRALKNRHGTAKQYWPPDR